MSLCPSVNVKNFGWIFHKLDFLETEKILSLEKIIKNKSDIFHKCNFFSEIFNPLLLLTKNHLF